MKRWKAGYCRQRILRLKFILLGALIYTISFSQDTATITADTSVRQPVFLHKDSAWPFGVSRKEIEKKVGERISRPHKKRIRFLAAGNVLAYTGSMLALNEIWYKDYPRSSFHFFNDNNEWQRVDKAGHAFSAYVASRASMEMWRWAGLKRKQRIWIGGMSGALYQTVIETLDGFSAEWGWSWGDFAANMVGSGLVIGQELAWDEQRINLKYSTHHTKYPAGHLRERADHLFGKSFGERMFKDYNAQTIWLSANLKSFLKTSNLPPWLNLAFGYGGDGMFDANENTWTDAASNMFDRRDIPRYRQFYLAPDIDLTRIKTSSKFLKVILFILNTFKFPAPALELSQGKLRAHLLYL
jgi:uncharacterized protein YfiM (DUF2279 family)